MPQHKAYSAAVWLQHELRRRHYYYYSSVPCVAVPLRPCRGQHTPVPPETVTLVAHAQKEAAHRSHVSPAWL